MYFFSLSKKIVKTLGFAAVNKYIYKNKYLTRNGDIRKANNYESGGSRKLLISDRVNAAHQLIKLPRQLVKNSGVPLTELSATLSFAQFA